MIKLDGKQDCATDERAVPEGVDTQKGKAIADHLYQYSPDDGTECRDKCRESLTAERG